MTVKTNASMSRLIASAAVAFGLLAAAPALAAIEQRTRMTAGRSVSQQPNGCC